MLAKFTSNFTKAALTEVSGKSLTYGELLSEMESFNELLGPTRQLVAIFCRNNIDSIIGYLAAMAHGHVALLLDGDPTLPKSQHLLNHFQASKIWAWNEEEQRSMLSDTGFTAPKMHPSLALLLSTSGSTGSTKLVRLSLDNLDSNAEAIASYLGISDDEKPITTLPMNYSYGLSVINSHLSKGAEIILTDQSIATKEFWQLFKDKGATSFAGVPFTYQILHRLRIERMDLPTLRYFTQAGGKLSDDLVLHFSKTSQESGKRFYVMYGQTEATARIAYLPTEFAGAHPNSIGIPIPNSDILLRDEYGQDIGDANIAGELIFKGANVMLGYATTSDDLALPDELQGVLATGDIAYRNDEGLYFIVGRKKRFIKITGNRIGLDEIEDHLNSQGFRVAVVGVDDQLHVLLEGSDCEAISTLLWKTFAIHPRYSKVLPCEIIPRSSSGKTLYVEVEKYFGARL